MTDEDMKKVIDNQTNHTIEYIVIIFVIFIFILHYTNIIPTNYEYIDYDNNRGYSKNCSTSFIGDHDRCEIDGIMVKVKGYKVVKGGR